MPQPPVRRLLAVTGLALTVGACAERGDGFLDPAPAELAVEAAVVAAAARPLTGAAADLDPLVALAAGARVVMLGEASHGTHEFYETRARITRRLMDEHGFTAVVVEGDWPEAARVNRWVRGTGSDASAEQALSSFVEFPRWMWRNAEVRDLVRWLRTTNDARPPAEDVGFYGMDVYGLYEAIDAVLAHLDATDPAAAARVRARYACFDPHRPDPQAYGAAASRGGSCAAQAAEALAEVRASLGDAPADPVAAEAEFAIHGHARSVANAEAYFRTIYTGAENSWNLRDRGMLETLEALMAHLERTTGRPARIVVWAHNTHVGDARATASGAAGEITVGQLVRERYGPEALLTGFLTHDGTVFAASQWGEAGRVFDVRPSLRESYGALFHETGLPAFLLVLRDAPADVASVLGAPRLERAIGVQYVPATERQSHYFVARLGQQFDAVFFFDETRAVTPLP